MNILLTGGAGYIASHTSLVLEGAGHNVVLIDNFSNSRRSVSGRLNQICKKVIPCFEGDIRNTSLLIKTMSDFKIDSVMHFAGLKSVSESNQQPLKYYDNNIAGSISLLEAMKKTGVKTIVFSSSATVYGAPNYLPYDEKHPLNPINTYGRTKLQVEQILLDLANSDPTWSIALLRYFNPVGAHESGLIGEDPNGIPNNLMPYITQVASGKLPHLDIFGNNFDTNDGTGERDYIHVVDLAKGHLAALDYIQNNDGCEAFNLGTGNRVSVLDLVQAYEKASGKKIPIKIAPRRLGDLASCYANPKKAFEIMGWKAVKTIDDMCSSTLKWEEFKRGFHYLEQN